MGAAAKRREREKDPLLSPLKLFGTARVWEKGPRGEAMEATEGFEANDLGSEASIEGDEHAIFHFFDCLSPLSLSVSSSAVDKRGEVLGFKWDFGLMIVGVGLGALIRGEDKMVTFTFATVLESECSQRGQNPSRGGGS